MAKSLERATRWLAGLPSDWRWAVSVVAVCAVLSAVMRISIDGFAVFLLPLSGEFGWARTEAVSIYGLTMLSFGTGCLMAGRTMDRLGPRVTYTVPQGESWSAGQETQPEPPETRLSPCVGRPEGQGVGGEGSCHTAVGWAVGMASAPLPPGQTRRARESLIVE